MKKYLLSAVLCTFTLSNLYAQTKTYGTPAKSFQNTKILNQVPSTPPLPPPPPTSTNSGSSVPKSDISGSIYTLSSVRVTIKTGNDNKEFPSKVNVIVKTRDALNTDLSPFTQKNLSNEMRVNSDTEFGLERDVQLRGDAKLDDFQKSGLKLQIFYYANFFADAWKIESVSMTVEFKDQFGNLHPTLGRKTIVFTNAYGFLNYDYRIMECVTDGSFTPITAVIKP